MNVSTVLVACIAASTLRHHAVHGFATPRAASPSVLEQRNRDSCVLRADRRRQATLEHCSLFTAGARQPEPAPATLPESAAAPTLCTGGCHSTVQSVGCHLPQESLLEDSTPSRDGALNRHAAKDWWYNLKSLPQSSVLREIRHPIATMTAWATVVSVVHRVLLGTGRTAIAQHMSIPHAAHSFLVSMLGLLLVFRTNSAYQRFQEGRKIWEDILGVSRNFSRLITIYRNEVGIERVRSIKNMVAAFPYLLRHHVRSGCLCKADHESIPQKYKLELLEPLNGRRVVDTRYEGDRLAMASIEKQNRLASSKRCFVDKRDWPWALLDNDGSDSELRDVAMSSNRPLWVCHRLGRELMSIPATDHFTSRERLNMLNSIDKLSATIGQCERIHQTAVPPNYARHALRALSMWLLTVPFALVKDMGLLTGPATGLITWVLFGVYQIGHMIEDPFQKSLRLSILCDSIRRDVLHEDLDGTMSSRRDSAFDCVSSDLNGHDHVDGGDGDFLNDELSSDYVLPRLVFDSIFPQRTEHSVAATISNYSGVHCEPAGQTW